MLKLAVVNRKGGTGKSVVARELAYMLDKINPTRLIDADPHGCQTDCLLNGDVVHIGGEHKIPFFENCWTVYDFAGEDDKRLKNVLEKMDLVVIPYTPSFASMERTLKTYEFVQKRNEQIMFVCNMYKSEKDVVGSKSDIEEALDKPILSLKLRDSRGIRTAENEGVSCFELYKKGGINKRIYMPIINDLLDIIETVSDVCELNLTREQLSEKLIG
jgi:cellulose biosynthesis protein BcsQ